MRDDTSRVSDRCRGRTVLGRRRRRAIQEGVSVVLLWAWVVHAQPAGQAAAPATDRQQFPCFAYHRFGDQRAPSTSIQVDVFRAQLQHLRDEGYTVLTLSQALDSLDTTTGVPARTTVLTIDDGYASVWTGAVPLLREFGWEATIFVNTISVGKPGYLSWEQLATLAAEGFEIGNHSHGHPYFLDIEPERRAAAFRQDIAVAQDSIQARLGDRPRALSYPFGEWDPALALVARELGIQAAVAQNSGVIHRRGDRYALPRFPMGGPYATLAGFQRKLAVRALPIREQSPASPVLTGANPPTLELLLDPTRINVGAAQCFVDGRRTCRLERDPDDPRRLIVHAEHPLTQRRTLYTVTAPGAGSGRWHWYSHLWVQPGVAE